jgi:hypothetical protein
MRSITSIIPTDDFLLLIKFENGVEKKFDIRPLLELPAFSPLKDTSVFKKVSNKGYFIEWQNEEIDLSADTLWHEGK